MSQTYIKTLIIKKKLLIIKNNALTFDAKLPVPLLENEGLDPSTDACEIYEPGPGFSF